MPLSYKIVTICNRLPVEHYYCLDAYQKSLGDKVPMVISNQYGEYQGLGDKPKFLKKAIENGDIKSTHIIFTDCWDFVFGTDFDELFHTYLLFNSPIVISAEKTCFPETYKKEYDALPQFGVTSYNYLNSGFIIGETEAIYELLKSMDLDNVPDDYRKEDGTMCHINDQELYQEAFLKQPVKMVLDRQQFLCQTLHTLKKEDFSFGKNKKNGFENRIRNKETDSFPCTWHFNGSAKDSGIQEPILNHLKLR